MNCFHSLSIAWAPWITQRSLIHWQDACLFEARRMVRAAARRANHIEVLVILDNCVLCWCLLLWLAWTWEREEGLISCVHDLRAQGAGAYRCGLVCIRLGLKISISGAQWSRSRTLVCVLGSSSKLGYHEVSTSCSCCRLQSRWYAHLGGWSLTLRSFCRGLCVAKACVVKWTSSCGKNTNF